MNRSLNETRTYDDKVEAVAQKYYEEFILNEGTYRWAIDKEMKKVGLSDNDDLAESDIIRRLDALVLQKRK